MEDSLASLVEKLQGLGLTKREAEVYLAIWMKNGATVKELLDLLDVHQPQLYNIIQSLIRKGFVKASAGRPRIYIASDIVPLIDVQKMKLDLLKESLQEELIKLRNRTEEETPYISIVRSLEGILASIIEIVNSAEIEIRAELPYTIFKELKQYLLSALQRGVNLYLLVYPEEETFDEFQMFKDRVKIKTSELGNFLLVISDLSVAVYSKRRFFTARKLSVSNSEVYGYEIQEKDLLLRLLNIHNNLWRKAKEVICWEHTPEVYPKVLLEFSTALDEIENLFKLGYVPIVTVEGRYVKDGQPVKLTGKARSINMAGIISNFVLDIGTREVTIGGFDAEVEDIEAQKVIIEKIIKNQG
ncbi:TrmB family transcriptional regulator [Thermococcus sp.]